jgi:hypothetical protein
VQHCRREVTCASEGEYACNDLLATFELFQGYLYSFLARRSSLFTIAVDIHSKPNFTSICRPLE